MFDVQSACGREQNCPGGRVDRAVAVTNEAPRVRMTGAHLIRVRVGSRQMTVEIVNVDLGVRAGSSVELTGFSKVERAITVLPKSRMIVTSVS